MIDEKKLIDLLQGGEGSEKYKVEFNYNREDGIEKIVSDALDAYVTMLIGAIRDMRKEDGWIPCSERLPEDDNYILVSFENYTLPDIARYEEDESGGAFYPGDEDKSYASFGLFVNAWQPLPEPYREGDTPCT